MNLALKIAKRYLISKKSTNAINIIAGVSVLGMIVGTAALILVLSVFNGFEDLVTSLYNTFNPDLKITVKKGKTFDPDTIHIDQLRALKGVNAISEVLEENALLQYKDKDFIGRLKGVDDVYEQVSEVDTAIIDGQFLLKDGERNYAILGVVVESILGVNIHNEFTPLKVFMPKREGKVSTMRPENAFRQSIIYPSGTFAIQQDFDSRYIIVPMRFMREILSYERAVSALEIALDPKCSVAQLQSQIKEILGDNFEVKNRYEQDVFLYKVMKTEKWAVYFILTFILMVAAFNIIGSLSMLVIEKSRDIGILKAMGATRTFIKRIFFVEGILLALTGAGIGSILAVTICLIQQHFKIIKLQGASFLIDAYPVSMRWEDFALVFVTVVVIATIASIVPALKAANQSQLLKKE